MARGNPLRASEIGVAAEQLPAGYARAFQYFNASSKVRDVFQDLATDAGKHAHGKWADGYVTGRAEDVALHRLLANRLRIVEAVKALPEAIRRLVEAPRGEIESLHRGVSDDRIKDVGQPELAKSTAEWNERAPSTGWSNGNYVYGFTKDEAVARQFKEYGHEVHGAQVIGAGNIKSFEGIIDLQKLASLVKAYAESTKGKFKDPMWLSHYAHKEKEYLVYGITFKRSGDRYYKEA